MYLARLTSSSKYHKYGKKSSITSKHDDKTNGTTKKITNLIQKNRLITADVSQNSIIDKLLKDAVMSGDLDLNSKGLKEFPKFFNIYSLLDTIHCDLSKNHFNEFPKEICVFIVLETLVLYSNNIRSLPESISSLKSLKMLDLSCNSISYLPTSLCSLRFLEVLNLSNNKLVSLPEEIYELEKLIQLDVSSNEITHLPVQIGEMKSLRSLNIRRNLLVELPKEISKIKLISFDCSFNRLTKLPLRFREIITLIDLNVDNNPLELPPSAVCAKGLLHIMKYLLNETIKAEKKHGILSENEINFQYSGSVLYQSTKKNASICHANNKPKEEIHDSPDSNQNNDEKEKFKNLSRKMHEEQLAVFEKQRQGSQHSLMKDMKQMRRLTNDTIYTSRNESLINLNPQKTFLENRSYKSLSNLENNSTNIQLKPMNENNNDKISNEANVLHFNNNNQLHDSVSINNYNFYNLNANEINGDSNILNSTSNKIYCEKNGIEYSLEINNSVYTMKRNYHQAQEELKQIDFLKRCIESKLKITLPDVENVGNALSDGVVLCHLMNQLFPRAIQMIHVPSLAVPKLSIAKCRKNVEAFIEACEKFGLPQNEICCSHDIIESKNTHKVSRTVMLILKYNEEIQYQNGSTSTKNNLNQQQTAV